MTRLRISTLLAIAVLSVPTLGLCKTAAEAPVVIGAAIAQTGFGASLGTGEVKAINMFVKQANANGGIAGHPLKVVIYDTGSKAQKALLDVRKLIVQDQAVGVVCCTGAPASMAILNTVQRHRVPNISLAADASIVEPVSKRHWIFKTPPIDAIMIAAEVQDMQKLGIKTVAFMRVNINFGLNGLNAFKKAAAAAGIRLVGTEQFGMTDTNMAAQAAKVVAAHPDAVFIWSVPPSANVAQKAVRAAGYKGTIYQGYGVTNPTFLRLGRANLNGTRVSVLPVIIYNKLPDSLPFRPAVEDFVKDYKAAYAEAPSSFAGHAYDAMLIFSAAAENVLTSGTAGLSDTSAFRAALRDAIENLGTFQGVDGTFTYSSQDHVGLGPSSAIMTVIENGHYNLVRYK